MRRISNDAMGVLSSLQFSANKAMIVRELDRKLYVEVNGALEALGGKWNRKEKAHVFPSDASELVDSLIDAGGYVDQRKALGFFETTPAIAKRLVELADVRPGMKVLEPSAGHGAILRYLPAGLQHVTAVEVDEGKLAEVRQTIPCPGPSASIYHIDFLQLPIDPIYHAAVMNPPFAKQADVAHITRAFQFLRPGGRLAAVASSSVTFRQDRKAKEFRELVERNGGSIEPLPEGSFKSSGTTVNTVIVTMRRGS